MSNAITSSRLTHLYRDAGRPNDLFPVFDRTASFQPWIFVLAIMPTLFAFQHAALSETDSEWVLRSLDLLKSESVEGMVSPGGRDSISAIQSQPPMSTWLMAAVQNLLPGKGAFEAMIVSWLGTVLLVAGCYWIVSDLYGGRVAMWAVLIASGQTVVLGQAQTVLPISFTILFGLLSVRWFANHLAKERSVITWPILGGGLALGMCLLLGGPAVLLFAGLQLVQCLAAIKYDRPADESSISIVEPSRRLMALCLLWVTCFASAGWWPLMMSSAYGLDFWKNWFIGLPTQLSPLSELDLTWSFFDALGPMVGLSFYGLLGIFGRCVSREATGDRSIALWFILGFAGWMLGRVLWGPESLFTQCSVVLVALSLVIAAAIAFNEVTTGKLRVTWATLWTLVPMIAFYSRSIQHTDEFLPLLFSSEGFVILSLIVLLIFCLLDRRDFSPRRWPRLFAALFLSFFTLAHFGTAVASPSPLLQNLESRELHSDELARLQKLLDEIPGGIQEVVVISEREETARLRLQLVLNYPSRNVVILKDWDELMARLSGAPHKPTTLVLEWRDRNSRERNQLADTWIRRYLGRPQKLGGTDLRLSVFFPKNAPL
ncbi:MAG: glycosyltransferase family 39 protein [Planctomycetaceae bacterium]|nr:glycosyltransferase family 39 protein [Planctomycetaceae bacterium]